MELVTHQLLATQGPHLCIVRLVSDDYLLRTAAYILNGQSPRCYSHHKNIGCSVRL
jgi:hypothetical protein